MSGYGYSFFFNRRDQVISQMISCIPGCQFMGNRVEVAEHKKKCTFKDETQLITLMMKEV